MASHVSNKKTYSQLFKTPIPLNILTDFLFLCSVPDDNKKKIVFDLHAYKRAVYNQILQPFLDACKPFYFASKQKYLSPQPLTFVSVATIIRQICRFHRVSFSKHLVYDKSSYEMVYYISLDSLNSLNSLNSIDSEDSIDSNKQ